MASTGPSYEFGPFRLDVPRRTLLLDGAPVALTLKAFDTLLILVQRSGEVVEKEELLKTVWPETFVEEATLTQNIYTLRKVLAEGGGEERYIDTVTRRGYRFAAPVREVSAPASDDASPRASRVRKIALPILLSLLVAAIGIAVYRGFLRREGEIAPRSIESIAALPFEVLGSEAETEFLGIGMADAVITRLSDLQQLTVRPTSAVLKYAEGTPNAMAVGGDLRVDAVLEGTVQKAGLELRVTVRLVGVEDGEALWADKYDIDYTDIFSVQDEISERVADTLQLRLTGQERSRWGKRLTSSTEAYEAYIRGRYFWNQRDQEKAIGYFHRAIEIDNDFAAAYAAMADSYMGVAIYRPRPPKEAYAMAKQAASRAIALDGELAEAHTALANMQMMSDWDWSAAEASFRRAVELDPDSPAAHHAFAFLLAATGKHDQAVAHARRARELDPLSLHFNNDLGMMLYSARRFEEAIEQYRETLELNPRFANAHFCLGLAYRQVGRLEEAIQEAQLALELSGGNPAFLASLGHSLAVANRRQEALKILDELRRRATHEYVVPSHFAVIFIGLGDKDRALESLEQACDERAPFVLFLNEWPLYDPLRSDPRFEELVARVGLGSM